MAPYTAAALVGVATRIPSHNPNPILTDIMTLIYIYIYSKGVGSGRAYADDAHDGVYAGAGADAGVDSWR